MFGMCNYDVKRYHLYVILDGIVMTFRKLVSHLYADRYLREARVAEYSRK